MLQSTAYRTSRPKRVYAHYFLGMSEAAIAKAEGVRESTPKMKWVIRGTTSTLSVEH